MAGRFIPAIATQSIGRAWHHRLEHKLAMIAKHGFEAIEVFFEDLEGLAKDLPPSYPPRPAGASFLGSTEAQECLLAAASYVHHMCLHHNLEVLCLQPFTFYDGLRDSTEHEKAIAKLRFWIRVANELATDLIQIPSNFLAESECTGDRDRIVADLREVADIGLECRPPIRFAYEALCWGTHVDTWDEAWSITLEVDRPNFGACLDTFNLCGRVYADPSVPSGLNANAEQDMKQTIEKLRTLLPLAPEKIFYVEVCDGERLERPIQPGHDFYRPEQKPRMSWSRNARLLPFEKPGYLPFLETLEAILESGYTGCISFELFSRTANQPDANVPEDHARRSQVAWNKLVEYMHWQNSGTSSDVSTPESNEFPFLELNQATGYLKSTPLTPTFD